MNENIPENALKNPLVRWGEEALQGERIPLLLRMKAGERISKAVVVQKLCAVPVHWDVTQKRSFPCVENCPYDAAGYIPHTRYYCPILYRNPKGNGNKAAILELFTYFDYGPNDVIEIWKPATERARIHTRWLEKSNLVLPNISIRPTLERIWFQPQNLFSNKLST